MNKPCDLVQQLNYRILLLFKREVCESQTLSRNCIWEFISETTVSLGNGKGLINDDRKSGDLPVSKHQSTYEDREVLMREAICVQCIVNIHDVCLFNLPKFINNSSAREEVVFFIDFIIL